MTVDVQQPSPGRDPRGPIPFRAPRRRHRKPDGRGGRTRLRKLRILAILVGLTVLAFISTVFGMMMAVASDLPQLENRQQYKLETNSFLYDDHWRPIGLFAPPDNVVIDRYGEISPYMSNAIVSVEDRRFWSDAGFDLRGMARALVSDVSGGSRQGGSTIAQQFVKNALAEQNDRTVFEKLREAALAYHLTRKWQKQKVLTEYLNSIYFGNGAYGIESAARVYFGKEHQLPAQAGTGSSEAGGTGTSSFPACGDGTRPDGTSTPKCASMLAPWEAALIAGMVADPSAYDPTEHPMAARKRRNLVLKDMYQQHYITAVQYEQGIAEPLPTSATIQQPSEPTPAPYFTSWLRPEILAAMGLGHGVPSSVAEYRAYYGGLKIRTTLDLKLQQAADQAIAADLPYTPGGPAASLVAIDNQTGQIRAMVGGPVVNGREDYGQYPFNLATEGHRQPGSSFKPFTLAVALEAGFGAGSVFTSAPITFTVPHSAGKEKFAVHNFGNAYSGTISLYDATAVSDNSVYARLGIQGLGPSGTKRVAHLARRMGVRSPLSTNYAMILGGLKIGVSPLDMAHAYESFATGGNRVFDPTLGAPDKGPTGIAQIQCYVVRCRGRRDIVDHPEYERVLPGPVAKGVHDMLEGVVQSGTGTKAAISGVDVVGKTGTTSNYGDAWFVGWTPKITVAVWVGVPDKLVPMTTAYGGQPVEGGTYPAIIWHDFVSQALQILAVESPAPKPSTTDTTGSSGSGSGGAGSLSSSTTDTTGSSGGAGTTGAAGATGAGATSPPAGAGSGAAAGGTGSPGATTGGTAGGGGTGAGGTGNAGGGTTGGGDGTTGGGGGTAGTGGAGVSGSG